MELLWSNPVLFINMILAVTIIFLGRKNPPETLAWIMVLFFLPIFGLLLYIFFSQKFSKRKLNKLTMEEEVFSSVALETQAREMKDKNYRFTSKVAEKWKMLIYLNQVYGEAYVTQDNSINIITDGNEKMEKLIRDIYNAEESISVQYFVFKNDKVGKRLLKALTKKAEEGLDVRLLVDALGSRSMTPSSYEEYLKAGGKFASFFPTKLRFINLKLNYRNHRKIVIIDSKIAYIGGYNIGKEYIGLKRKFGYWRDTHLRICGGAVQDVNIRFMMDWRFAANDEACCDNSCLTFSSEATGENIWMQILSSGPESIRQEIKRCFLKMITTAEKNVFLQTPYFVPDSSILEALKMAAQSGVDVRIMIPNKPDHMFVYWATYSYVAELINSGAKVFVYNNGFLHAKTLMVDGEVFTVGSANFDRRSFRLNFETNAVVYDEKLTGKLEEEFEKDMMFSYELTKEKYEERGLLIRIKEPIARLLSDIL